MPMTPLEVLADARALWRRTLEALTRHVNECRICDSHCSAYAQASQAETAAFEGFVAARKAVLS